MMIHGLNQEVHSVNGNTNTSKDPFGWTVTPFKDGSFTSFAKGEIVIDQVSKYNTLFPPVVNEQLPLRFRFGGNMPNGLFNR